MFDIQVIINSFTNLFLNRTFCKYLVLQDVSIKKNMTNFDKYMIFNKFFVTFIIIFARKISKKHI